MQDENPPVVEGHRIKRTYQAVAKTKYPDRSLLDFVEALAIQTSDDLDRLEISYRVLVKRIEAALRIILEHPESPHAAAQKALEVLDGD